jgi:LasA protease
MLRLVNRISGLGRATAVLVLLALGAIIGQTIMPVPTKSAPAAAGLPEPKTISRKASRPPAPRPPGRATPLESQVQTLVLALRGTTARRTYGVPSLARPLVRLSRVDNQRGWALGTSAIPLPAGVAAMPEASVFVARRTGAKWSIELAGTKGFLRLVKQAPVSLIPQDERAVLTGYGGAKAAAQKAGDTGLTLPWAAGQSWSIQAPVEGQQDLGFSGGDGRVRAPGDGRLFRLCSSAPGRGLLLLIHANGLATEYYQLTDVPNLKDGSLVKRGDLLGRVGTDQPCGAGSARPRTMVRFGLRGADRPLTLDGRTFGGWTLRTASGPISAERKGIQVVAGNPLLNFGPGIGGLPISPSPSPAVTSSPGAKPKPTPAAKPT